MPRTSVEQAAARRLQRICAAASPQPVAVVPCAGPSIRELEGEAIGRLSAVKVVLLNFGERGGPLASKGEVEKCFQQRSLKPVWVDQVDAIPADTTIIVTTGTAIGPEVLAKAPKLMLVAVAFTGFDHIDMAACKARGITVVNVPDYSTDATAELALGMILSHLRRLPQCQQVLESGLWSCPPQEDLRSKSVGIVGVGKIGLRLTELLKAFRVKRILGYSLTEDAAFTASGGVYVESLAGLFLDSDIIAICVPLTQKTRGLISENLLELLRPECILVNVSRGGVVDEVSLGKFLRQRRFRAALDVYSEEPLPAESELRALPVETLIVTPHVGYRSHASLALRLEITIKNILAALAGGAVNKV